MKSQIRVRFAPSPTGPLHIGGLRTALFNYLFARKHQGTFILRIEDTDQKRFVDGAEQYIIDSLNWLGIPFDEGPGKDGGFGPYRQSERQAFYQKYAQLLIENDWAYYAFDTAEELDYHRKNHEEKGKTFIYNWHNREKLKNSLSLPEDEVALKIENGDDYVIRFKWPKDLELEFEDQIRGTIRINANTLDDKVLFKSDGMPTYHLANIVDDHLMKITHVIRGEEWLPSLALHIQLYKALGWEAPEFAHLPLILKPTGKGKLSKRDGDKLGFPVFPLEWESSPGYKESGFFPETVMNFLALLGWNPGTEQELFTKEELISQFELGRVHKSGARFDPEKNKWYNHQYLQLKPLSELRKDFITVLKDHQVNTENWSEAFIDRVMELIRERASFVHEFWEIGAYFFEAPVNYDEKAAKKQWKEGTAKIMTELITVLNDCTNYSSDVLEMRVKQWITDTSLSFGQVMPPLRLALVGEMKGPHIFEIMELLGKNESNRRIQVAVEKLDASSNM